MNKQTYLEIITEQIRCKKALLLVTRELEAHIEDQKTAYMAEGMTEQEAEEEAVCQMGDPVEVGIEMDRIHRPKMAWRMMVGILLLNLLGAYLLYILQIRFKDQGVSFLPGQEIQNILVYLLEIILGFGLMVGVCYLDYSWIGKHAKKIMVVFILFLIVLNLGFGTKVNGSMNWICFPGGISITLSTIMFLTVPLYGAVLYQYREQGYRGIAAGILWMIVPVFFVFQIPLSQTVLLALAFLIVLSAAILKGWFRVKTGRTLAVLWGTATLVPLAGCMKIIASGQQYQKDRIYSLFPKIFLGNTDTGLASDYQRQALKELAIGSRIVGANEHLEQAVDSLQEGADFVFAYVLAYYGILAAVLLVGMVILLFLKLFKISVHQKNQLGMLMGTGCTVIFLLQITMYVTMNLGWLPRTILYCPFLTYGGTGMLVTYIILGLLLSICRYQNVLADSESLHVLQD